MIRYKMFEKEITKGAHTSFHFCVDKFGNNFHPKSKQYPIDQELSTYNKDFSDYECAITTSTTTSEGDYFHITSLTKNRNIIYLEQDVLEMFNIPIDFDCIYFTRAFPYVDGFKCRFDLKTFGTFGSTLRDDAMKVSLLFEGMCNAQIFAADFTKDGEYIDESINIEVLPYQSLYYPVSEILVRNFDIDKNKISYYNNKFKDYKKADYSWHIKIKLYKNRDPVVKFYRTYPINPYLKYYNYK